MKKIFCIKELLKKVFNLFWLIKFNISKESFCELIVLDF